MKHIIIFFIKAYQLLISPIFAGSCRFYPSCSEYAVESVCRFGSIKGTWMAIKRIGRCHPWHPGGFDPVPENEIKNVSHICCTKKS
jgi:putative membrane protein insertion efficiency factor